MKIFNRENSPAFTTYKTAFTAEYALYKQCEKHGFELHDIHYVIMVTKDGRFKPIVIGCDKSKHSMIQLFHSLQPVASCIL